MNKGRVDPLYQDPSSPSPPPPAVRNGFGPNDNNTSSSDGASSPKPPKPARKARKSFSGAGKHKADTRVIYCNKPEINVTSDFGRNSINTTKYTPLTFLPKNLFEQFRRAANAYFLVVALIQIVPTLSPTNPYSSVVPLIIVLGVTAIKEAVEDWKRRTSDNIINANPIQVLRSKEPGAPPAFTSIAWKDVLVGDIVRVMKDQGFPADLMILNSSENQGLCYIETANLDGETNLKLYQAVPETTHLVSEQDLSRFDAYITCEPPNTRLYTFNGMLTMASGEVFPLSAKQVLLRGCVLKNTDWIYGVVIYCGQETKLMQNATAPPSKRTTLERVTNGALLRIFLLVMIVCFIGAVGYGVWSTAHKAHWYLELGSLNIPFAGFKNFFTYMISFSVMIPISLYVSMEMVKVVQALLINLDIEMYYPDNDTPAKARTSNLSEELGQIEYIFSDKTGTLTRNHMEFLKCSIGGVSYGKGYTEIALTKAKREGRTVPPDTSPPLPGADPSFPFKDKSLLTDMESGKNQYIEEFFTLLSVCHTVIPEINEQTGAIRYQAASPDEGALVAAARNFGFFFHTRNPKDVVCDLRGKRKRFEILAVLEFNSTRKRMSVICRNQQDGVIRLLCKGADSVIMERMKSGQDDLAMTTLSHLEEFANDGLRTLCLSYRILDEATFNDWYRRYLEASLSITDREGKLMQVAEEIEKDLILLGATALEDKLQVGVPDTIFSLGKAGLKIWILTGDKQETAINIGFACSLLSHSMTILIVNASTREETLTQLEQTLVQQEKLKNELRGDSRAPEFGFVIDGLSLTFALEEELQPKLLSIALGCRSVICCRVSPLQKAQVVRLVKEKDKKVTLAIGDGANDVSMIQMAHIGVGISGQEGMQAVMSSDYAIAQFRFLNRLLLVHGRWSYKRVTKLILYSFYKNMVFALSQFWMSWYNGFSGQTMYDGWSITIFNVIFTGLPIIAYAIQEQDVPAEKATKYPQLYETGQKQQEFSMKILYLWLLTGVIHSIAIFFMNLFAHGFSEGIWELGEACYASVVVTVTFRLALEIHTWTWISVICTFGSMACWFFWMLLIGAVPKFITDGTMYQVPNHVFNTGIFWLSVLLVSMLCIFPDMAIIYYKRTYFPEKYHIVQEEALLEGSGLAASSNNLSDHLHLIPHVPGLASPAQSFAIKRVMNAMSGPAHLPSSASVESLERFTGFAFSDELGANEKLKYSFKRQNTEAKSASSSVGSLAL